MTKTIISTENAPKAIGPYSQAVATDTLMFLSGQIPIDPVTGVMVSGGIEEQARQVFRNMDGILKEGGCGVEDVVKTTIFLQDLNDFNAVNLLYAEFFPSPFPARSCVEVAALPKGARIEIEAIARKRVL